LPGALSDKPLATAIQGKMSMSSGPWLQDSSTSGLPPTDDPGVAEPFGKQRPLFIVRQEAEQVAESPRPERRPDVCSPR